jgi:hypothetical protein
MLHERASVLRTLYTHIACLNSLLLPLVSYKDGQRTVKPWRYFSDLCVSPPDTCQLCYITHNITSSGLQHSCRCSDFLEAKINGNRIAVSCIYGQVWTYCRCGDVYGYLMWVTKQCKKLEDGWCPAQLTAKYVSPLFCFKKFVHMEVSDVSTDASIAVLKVERNTVVWVLRCCMTHL